jgi:hypothetical protein
MATTYKAILNGDRLQWLGEAPETNGGIPVEIKVVSPSAPPDPADRGAAMAAALQKIADAGGVPEIPDPIAWQRETRKDRPLPGREE